ncbi:MAG: ATP-binding protein [Caldimonas sp.]
MSWLPFAAIALLVVVAAALATWLSRRPARPSRETTSGAAAEDLEDDPESFGYIVSHDLRAPIRVVEGFTKIVKEDYAGVLDKLALDHLDRVLGAAARMNHMIDALLALSRLSSQPLVHVPVDLSQLAQDVVDELRRQSPERDVTIEIEPGLVAEGDPTLLRMVLENLLGNAWKYTGQTEAARIGFVRTVGETGQGSRGQSFTVHDNGAGFDMRFAARLFGVFQRLHSASEFPGTGVGLASVRRIVQRHGGEIRAEAEPDKGARFHFTLA